jgi:hypothetical protein
LGNIISVLTCLEKVWTIMFTSRYFLCVEYNVLSKNVTRDGRQPIRKDIIWSHLIIYNNIHKKQCWFYKWIFYNFVLNNSYNSSGLDKQFWSNIPNANKQKQTKLFEHHYIPNAWYTQKMLLRCYYCRFYIHGHRFKWDNLYYIRIVLWIFHFLFRVL